MSSAELRVNLGLNSSQFTEGISRAESKAAQLAGRLAGMGGPAGQAFETLSRVIQQSGGSLEGFIRAGARIGIVGAAVGLANRAFQEFQNQLESTNKRLEGMNLKPIGGMDWLKLGLFGDTSVLKVDGEKLIQRINNEKSDADRLLKEQNRVRQDVENRMIAQGATSVETYKAQEAAVRKVRDEVTALLEVEKQRDGLLKKQATILPDLSGIDSAAELANQIERYERIAATATDTTAKLKAQVASLALQAGSIDVAKREIANIGSMFSPADAVSVLDEQISSLSDKINLATTLRSAVSMGTSGYDQLNAQIQQLTAQKQSAIDARLKLSRQGDKEAKDLAESYEKQRKFEMDAFQKYTEARDNLNEQRIGLESEKNIINAADPERQRLIEQRAEVKRLQDTYDKLYRADKDSLATLQAKNNLLQAQNALAATQTSIQKQSAAYRQQINDMRAGIEFGLGDRNLTNPLTQIARQRRADLRRQQRGQRRLEAMMSGNGQFNDEFTARAFEELTGRTTGETFGTNLELVPDFVGMGGKSTGGIDPRSMMGKLPTLTGSEPDKNKTAQEKLPTSLSALNAIYNRLSQTLDVRIVGGGAPALAQ